MIDARLLGSELQRVLLGQAIQPCQQRRLFGQALQVDWPVPAVQVELE
ncbi:hypothetical protein [Andreprevotia lacus]